RRELPAQGSPRSQARTWPDLTHPAGVPGSHSAASSKDRALGHRPRARRRSRRRAQASQSNGRPKLSSNYKEQKRNMYVILQHSNSNFTMLTKDLLPLNPIPWLFFTHRLEVPKKGAKGNGGTVGSEEPRRGSPAGFHRHLAH